MTPCKNEGCDFIAIDVEDGIRHLATCRHRKGTASPSDSIPFEGDK
jgi:hypothetical protein